MAKEPAEHKFGNMDTEQNEQAWGAFLKFWGYCFVVSLLIALFFMSLAAK